MRKLTEKQSLFCLEYLIDLNATQAAIRSGYSEKTAYSQGQRLLKNVEIQSRTSEMMLARSEKAKVNASYVLNRLVEIDSLDVLDILDDEGNMLAIKSWPKSWRVSISGLDVAELNTGDVQSVIKKIKWPDKLRNLELLGKHIDVKAFDGEPATETSPIHKVTIEVVR